VWIGAVRSLIIQTAISIRPFRMTRQAAEKICKIYQMRKSNERFGVSFFQLIERKAPGGVGPGAFLQMTAGGRLGGCLLEAVFALMHDEPEAFQSISTKVTHCVRPAFRAAIGCGVVVRRQRGWQQITDRHFNQTPRAHHLRCPS